MRLPRRALNFGLMPTSNSTTFQPLVCASLEYMGCFGFANKLREGKTIQIFIYGNCKRDFTYAGDIVEGVVRVIQ